VNAEFNWWLLIVGLVIGAGLVYLVLADSSRHDADVLADELPREATWIAASMTAEGRSIDPPTAERVLELHRAYLSLPPPDPEPGPRERTGSRASPTIAAEPRREPAGSASARADGRREESAGDDPDVERDAPEPQSPDRDVPQPGGPHRRGE
jgi:hypothetical protein